MNARAPLVPGLEDVVVATTRLSRVEGQAGRLTLAGYAIEELAPALPFEAVVHLLWRDQLPSSAQLEQLRTKLAARRELGSATVALLRAAAARELAPIDALRVGVASLALDGALEPERIVAALPALVAAYLQLSAGSEPLAPDPDLGLSADFLRCCTGARPSDARVRALDTYLATVADHGFNASTFTARIVASTRAELGGAIEAALAALAGPLHGGAPGPALEALLELRAQPGDLDANTRAWVRERVAAGERIMGFGHRVYKTRDPRADVLARAADELLQDDGLDELARDARVHERAVLETLAQLKPGRPLATNVEFYTALLLHALGFAPRDFTCVFAIGRAAGWTAHIAEQQAEGRLIRPRARYVGATSRSLRRAPVRPQ